jgi:hypothetical protein
MKDQVHWILCLNTDTDKSAYRGPDGRTPVFQSLATAQQRCKDVNKREGRKGTGRYHVTPAHKADMDRLAWLGYRTVLV